MQHDNVQPDRVTVMLYAACNFRFSQRCSWRFESSGMLRRVECYIFTKFSWGSRCLPLQESCFSRAAWPRKCKHNVPSETWTITRRRESPYDLQPFIITFDRTNCRNANMADFHLGVPTRSDNKSRYRFISECFDGGVSSVALIPWTLGLIITMDFNRCAISFQLCSK